jgi:Cu+-exporting ATPase
MEIVVGNRRLMRERNVEMFEAANTERIMREMEINGETAVCVAMDGVFVGVIGIADQIKGDAAETIEKMHEMGIDVYLVTGDSTTTAKAVAKSLRVPEDRVFSEVLPADKANYVQSLQSRGRVVAMVGDGINDSPALAQADVGIALGSGSQIAIESADMVIVKNRLMDVLVAFDLSRSVFHRIRMNFVWAMGYNLVGIPIAAGFLYPFLHVGLPPQFAGLAMAFSSVSVVVSSLHLKYYKTPRERDEGYRQLGMFGWCLSIPGQLCSCCVDAIFADGKIRSGRGIADNLVSSSSSSSSSVRRRRPTSRQRGQYSKVNDEEDVDDWGDGCGDLEMV